MTFLLFLAEYSLYPAKFYIKKFHNREKEIKLLRGIETKSRSDSTISGLITGRKGSTKSASSQSMRLIINLSSPNSNVNPLASIWSISNRRKRHLHKPLQQDYSIQRTLA